MVIYKKDFALWQVEKAGLEFGGLDRGFVGIRGGFEIVAEEFGEQAGAPTARRVKLFLSSVGRTRMRSDRMSLRRIVKATNRRRLTRVRPSLRHFLPPGFTEVPQPPPPGVSILSTSPATISNRVFAGSVRAFPLPRSKVLRPGFPASPPANP